MKQLSNKQFLQAIIANITQSSAGDSKNWRGTLSNWIKC